MHLNLQKWFIQADAQKSQEAAKSVFGGDMSSENMPTTIFNNDELEDGVIGILDLLVKSGLTSSKNEGRRLVMQGEYLWMDKK